jgi:hypothetical protein
MRPPSPIAFADPDRELESQDITTYRDSSGIDLEWLKMEFDLPPIDIDIDTAPGKVKDIDKGLGQTSSSGVVSEPV